MIGQNITGSGTVSVNGGSSSFQDSGEHPIIFNLKMQYFYLTL